MCVGKMYANVTFAISRTLKNMSVNKARIVLFAAEVVMISYLMENVFGIYDMLSFSRYLRGY